jgi:serine/threonine-protein kinase
VGQPQNQAEATLQAKGFKVDVKTDATSSSPAGQVISQSPSGGTAPPNSTVTITVSGGAVSVPPVVGDSQATASQILTNAGFQVNVQQGSGPAQYANGTVFSQQPANGIATKGSTVTIYVQNGQSASAPPSGTGSPTVNPSGPANGTGGILGL